MIISLEASDIRPGSQFDSIDGPLLVIYNKAGSLTCVALDLACEINDQGKKLHERLNQLHAIPHWIKPGIEKEKSRLRVIDDKTLVP